MGFLVDPSEGKHTSFYKCPRILCSLFFHNQIILFFSNSYQSLKFNFSYTEKLSCLYRCLWERSLWSGKSWKEFYRKTWKVCYLEESVDNIHSLLLCVFQKGSLWFWHFEYMLREVFSSKFSRGQEKTFTSAFIWIVSSLPFGRCCPAVTLPSSGCVSRVFSYCRLQAMPESSVWRTSFESLKN